MSKTKSRRRKPMTSPAASRIQNAAAKAPRGDTQKRSFAARPECRCKERPLHGQNCLLWQVQQATCLVSRWRRLSRCTPEITRRLVQNGVVFVDKARQSPCPGIGMVWSIAANMSGTRTQGTTLTRILPVLGTTGERFPLHEGCQHPRWTYEGPPDGAVAAFAVLLHEE